MLLTEEVKAKTVELVLKALECDVVELVVDVESIELPSEDAPVYTTQRTGRRRLIMVWYDSAFDQRGR